jgi:hypothetical protein
MSRSGPQWKCDSYQGMPSGMPQAPHDESAFRRGISSSKPANVRRFFAKTFTAIVLLTLSVVVPWARAQKSASAKVTADLPPGPMQAMATTACTECHEARIILQQRLSKPAWTKEVDKMTKWGALVDPADREALIDYLSVNLSPDKPPYEPQRTTANTRDSRKASK